MPVIKGLLVNDASLLGHHGSALVTAQARRLAERAGIDLMVGLDWPTVERMLAGTHDFAVVIVNGEGSIHHNSKTAIRIAQLGSVLRASQTPAFLINASEEANSADVYAGLAKFRAVYVRDRPSQVSLARAGIQSTIVHDLTLTWDSCPIARGSGPVYVTDASNQTLARMLFDYARRIGATPISLRTAPPRPRGTWPRRRIGFEIKRLAGYVLPDSPWALRYSGSYRSMDDLVLQLSKHCGGLVTGRFHAVCLAIRMRLPFVAIAAETSKIENLLSDIGLENRLIDSARLDGSTSLPSISPFSKNELSAVQSFLDRTERDAQAMFDAIAADVSGRSVIRAAQQ